MTLCTARVSYGYPALLTARRTLGRVDGAIEVSKHRAGVNEESFPCVGQINPMRRTSKELNIQLFFDCLDLPAERRLLHAKPFGCPRDVPFFSDCDEIA
jgi:hypothetical protein